jgi:hypothetical protein
MTNVLIHRVSALVRMYQPGQALEFADSLLRTLLDKTRGSSAQLVKQMATRAGVNA